MRLIFGMLRLDGGPVGEMVLAAMARAMTPSGQSPRSVWRSDGSVGLGLLEFHPPQDGGPLDLASGPDGSLLAADLRLDRPDEAAAVLGLPPVCSSEAIALAGLGRWVGRTPGMLDGDYALAAWNPAERRLVLCRDIFGVRPLCHAHVPGRFLAFASLPKGIHGSGIIPCRPDLTALGRRVCMIYVDDEATGTVGISWLRPGHVLSVSEDGRMNVTQGWSPELAKVGQSRISAQEAARTLRALVTDAVACRLPAQGGVAAHLSGGLDSSAVSVLAARALRPSGRRLTVLSHYAAEDCPVGMDQDQWGAELVVAQEADLDQVIMRLSPDGNLADTDPDSSIAGFEIVNHLDTFRRAAENGARMLLTGAGGDEAATYNGANLHAALLRQGKWRVVAADLPRRSKQSGVPLWKEAVHRVLLPSLPFDIRRSSAPDPLSALDMLQPAIRDAVRAAMPPPLVWRNRPGDRLEMLRKGYLWPRNTCWALLAARFGLALSHPLLDRRVVDFMLSLPLERFLNGGLSRQPFRDAMAGILPEELRLSPVKGRPLPDAHRCLAEAKPALLAEAVRLKREPAVVAAIDLAAVEAALTGIPDPPIPISQVRDQRFRRAFAATRILSLGRHLARIG